MNWKLVATVSPSEYDSMERQVASLTRDLARYEEDSIHSKADLRELQAELKAAKSLEDFQRIVNHL